MVTSVNDNLRSAWNNCSTNVEREGCTIHDLFTKVLLYRQWQYFSTLDSTQQRYKELVDSLHHLCNNIEPGTNTGDSVSTDY